MLEADLNIPNAELLSKLGLMSNGKLKRAAVLLFYHDPQIVQTGSYVKVGMFEGSDILYQDIFEESLIVTASRIVDIIYLKYLKAKITYEHDRRVETYPYARNAIREAVYNAIAHNCYMYGTPIQIRIDPAEIIISNQCILPQGWTVDTLMERHESRPYNPDIAGVFYRMGYIETWGRGIQKICDACKELGAEQPRYELLGTGLRIYFKALKSALIDELQSLKAQSGNTDVALSDALEKKIIAKLKENPTMTQVELANNLGVDRRTIQRKIKELQESSHLVRVGGRRYGHWEVR